MRVIIDTNILVSAILRDRDPETIVLFIAETADYEWIVSSEILTEYKEVLSRPKFRLSEALKKQWFSQLDTLTTLIEVDDFIDFPRDQKDAKFLSCAIAANANFFITGDKDFSEAQRLLNTTIISLSLFKRLVYDTQ
jgi:uncharacterized protein